MVVIQSQQFVIPHSDDTEASQNKCWTVRKIQLSTNCLQKTQY
jgi:hypothetical protein